MPRLPILISWESVSEFPPRRSVDADLDRTELIGNTLGGLVATMRVESNIGLPDYRHQLRNTVEAALARSACLAGKNLRFEVHEDGVVLRGVVRSYYLKQLAQESLKAISGVRHIQNEIEVVTV